MDVSTYIKQGPKYVLCPNLKEGYQYKPFKFGNGKNCVLRFTLATKMRIKYVN